MPDAPLIRTYSNSLEFVKKGDLVIVDDRPGKVEEVCLPGTLLADSFSCEDTGGLLIRYDDGILVLEPFGNKHWIKKQ